MNSSKEKYINSQILIIGSGIIGKFNALQLSKQGFEVTIIDPYHYENSSYAAIGLLMGKIYQKRKGRSWELRKTSMKLWPKWLEELNKINPQLIIEKPLIKLTTCEDTFKKMKIFALQNQDDNLEILDSNSSLISNIQNFFCSTKIKGMVSYEDGRIDPKLLLDTIDNLLEIQNVNIIKNEVIQCKKDNNGWISTLKEGEQNIFSKVLILCNSLDTLKLIDNEKYKFKLEPVLGQAIEIMNKEESTNFLNMPKVINFNGKNIIRLNENKLIIGSTDEYTMKPLKRNLEELTDFLQDKPKWLDPKNISRKWFGIRSKPIGEGSPLLKSLEKGLILCAGFYKNGILLAPACSDWISEEIKKHI